MGIIFLASRFNVKDYHDRLLLGHRVRLPIVNLNNAQMARFRQWIILLISQDTA